MPNEAVARVTGRAQYTADLAIPGVAPGKVLRSPHAHARITRIDASRAEVLPGVVCVLTRDDLADVTPYYGMAYKDQPIVAVDKVRYAGEPVAGVVAEDEATALEALDLIEVDYEPLPAVLGIDQAMAPGAPLVHEEPLQKAGLYYDLKDLLPVQGTNVCHRSIFETGDVQRRMAAADRVFEHTFRMPPVNHYPLEPLVAVADFRGDALTLWSSTQGPFHVRQELADVFGLPMSRIRVLAPFLGGGFGAKTYTHIEPLVAALARKARRPVQLVLTAEETFETLCRCGFSCWVRTGVKRDGTLMAVEAEFSLDCGAYAAHAPRLVRLSARWVLPYRCPDVRISGNAVYTNTVPNAVLRGAPAPFMGWPRESQMDMIARELGVDPLEIRLRNALAPEEAFGDGQETLRFDVRAALRQVSEALNRAPSAKDGTPVAGKRRGRAVVCGVEHTAQSASSVLLSLAADGSLRINASAVEMGQGAREVLASVAADQLGIRPERITVTQPDTEVTPFEQITSASRTTTQVGGAVERAARAIRAEVATIFAQLYEVDAASVTFADGQVQGGGRSVPLGELVKARYNGLPGGELTAHATMGQSEDGSPTQVAVAGAEVEVDEDTGEVHVLRFISALSVGRAISRARSHGQNVGGSVYALGQALSEEMLYTEDGHLANGTLFEYAVPTFRTMPDRFESILIEDGGGPGPGGARGIGEAGSLIVMPVIANAVHDAVGVRFTDVPLTPGRVADGIAARAAGAAAKGT